MFVTKEYFSFELSRTKSRFFKFQKLEDLKIIRPLGQGAFGLVKLVKVKGIDHRAFALKCIQKHQVVQFKQQRHIKDEKNTLAMMQSPFILGLLKTYKG